MLRLLKLNGSTVWRSGTRSSSAIMARNPVLSRAWREVRRTTQHAAIRLPCEEPTQIKMPSRFLGMTNITTATALGLKRNSTCQMTNTLQRKRKREASSSPREHAHAFDLIATRVENASLPLDKVAPQTPGLDSGNPCVCVTTRTLSVPSYPVPVRH